MATQTPATQKNALVDVKKLLTTNEVKSRFNDILGAKAPQFMASLVNAVSGSKALKQCEPSSIMAAAFVAASLDLPIDPNLGRAYIIPYGDKAQFIVGYKGIFELAIRTGLYKDINTVEIYEDEILEYNPILGRLEFTKDFSKCTQRENGETDKIVGYYAYYELLTGFSKGLYMTKAQVKNHAKTYSQAYRSNKKDSPWFSNFDEMAKKTVLKRLLTKFSVLSIDYKMQTAIKEDQKVFDEFGEGEYIDNPNNEPEEIDKVDKVDKVAQEIMEEAEKPKKTAKKAEAKNPAPAPEPSLEDEFAAFEEGFMNIPETDDGLPFN